LKAFGKRQSQPNVAIGFLREENLRHSIGRHLILNRCGVNAFDPGQTGFLVFDNHSHLGRRIIVLRGQPLAQQVGERVL
jgi:hypothetical protein